MPSVWPLIIEIITCLLLQQVTTSSYNAKDFRELHAKSYVHYTPINLVDMANPAAASSHILPRVPVPGNADFQAPVILWTGAKIFSNETIFGQSPPLQLKLKEHEDPFYIRSRLKDKSPQHHQFARHREKSETILEKSGMGNRHKTNSGLLIESNFDADIYAANNSEIQPINEGAHYGSHNLGQNAIDRHNKLPQPLSLTLTNAVVDTSGTTTGRSEGRRRNKNGQLHHHHQHLQRKRKGRKGGGVGSSDASANDLDVGTRKGPGTKGRHADRQRQNLQRNGKN